ncbi:MAG: hypothetical protein P1U40_07345 [Coxiellaceae bacterium]|nr:hypothetical protein [Coxiellaceae bacterium]
MGTSRLQPRQPSSHRDVDSSQHFHSSAKYLAATMLSFTGGSTVLLHELMHHRRPGVYYIGDFFLLASIALAAKSGIELLRGLKKISPANIQIQGASKSFLSDGETQGTKPLCGINSRAFKSAAIGFAAVGLIASFGAVIDENYRIHKGLDKGITLLTEWVLGFGLAATAIAASAAVLAVKQTVWERKHPVDTTPYALNYEERGCLGNFCFGS